jgi:hypothetical protein
VGDPQSRPSGPKVPEAASSLKLFIFCHTLWLRIPCDARALVPTSSRFVEGLSVWRSMRAPSPAVVCLFSNHNLRFRCSSAAPFLRQEAAGIRKGKDPAPLPSSRTLILMPLHTLHLQCPHPLCCAPDAWKRGPGLSLGSATSDMTGGVESYRVGQRS